MIRILPLTEANCTRLLAVRQRRDNRAERVVARILADVRRRGDRAVLDWTRRLDGISLRRSELWVTPWESRRARELVSRELLAAVDQVARNVRRVAEQQKPQPWKLGVQPGVRVEQLVRPVESVGCYIPGGRFSLVSTLLMTAIPAQVAGVREIVVVCPRPNPPLLSVADRLGINRVARVGGAQAIAALAYGTQTIPSVEKIVGPGNRYVTTAKRLVSQERAIDLLAGPTEVLILARRARPGFLAADLLAQAEHDPEAIPLLVTTSKKLACQVRQELARMRAFLPKHTPASHSLTRNGAILLARSWRQAVQFANRFGPEHLSLPEGRTTSLDDLEAAGSIFLGPWTAQPLGDYATGSNHVLPTGGWARLRGGLSTADFVKCISLQQVSREGLRHLAPVVRALARAENLPAHIHALEVRL